LSVASAARSLAWAAGIGDLVEAERTRFAHGDRKRGAGALIERRRIHRARDADPAPEIEPGGPERVLLAQHVHLRPGELQHQLKGVGRDGGAGGDPGAATASPPALAPPLVGHPLELLVHQHVVVARLGFQRRLEALLDSPASALASSALVRPSSANLRTLKIS
jgi:hypothetical protein